MGAISDSLPSMLVWSSTGSMLSRRVNDAIDEVRKEQWREAQRRTHRKDFLKGLLVELLYAAFIPLAPRRDTQTLRALGETREPANLVARGDSRTSSRQAVELQRPVWRHCEFFNR